MFTRKYEVKARKVGGKVVFVPMYQEWYSFIWNTLLESKEDYCDTLQEATDIGIKFIIRDSIYAASGELVDIDEIEKHEDYEFARGIIKELTQNQNKP